MKERLALALVALTALLTLVLNLSPLPDAQDRLHALPRAGYGFTSHELPLAPQETAVLGRAKVIKRLYQVEGQRVVLMVIDGGSNRHAIHDPAYCFRGAGWTVRERRAFALDGGAAAVLTLARPDTGERQEAMYWISDDRQRYVEPWRYWWQTTRRRLTFGRSGAEPVMVILQPAAAGPFDWARLVDHFPVLLNF